MEWVESQHYQLRAYQRRRTRRFCFNVRLEPTQKGKGKCNTNIFLDSLRNDKRRQKFRIRTAEYSARLEFVSVTNNPPFIEKLTKNYLDLLKGLIIKDDRQIKHLVVKHEFSPCSDQDQPRISIDFYPFRDFLVDLGLIWRILYEYRPLNLIDELLNGDLCQFNKQDYSEIVKEESSSVRLWSQRKASGQFPVDVCDSMITCSQMNIQDALLRTMQPQLVEIVNCLTSRLAPAGRGRTVSLVVPLGRNQIKLRTPIHLERLPLTSLETKTKNIVEQELEKFKSRFPGLFPLCNPVGVFLLYVPPAHRGNENDLDNITKGFIVALRREFVAPAWMKEQAVTFYEALTLPRIPTDPDNGQFFATLVSPDFETELGRRIDHIVERFADLVSDR